MILFYSLAPLPHFALLHTPSCTLCQCLAQDVSAVISYFGTPSQFLASLVRLYAHCCARRCHYIHKAHKIVKGSSWTTWLSITRSPFTKSWGTILVALNLVNEDEVRLKLRVVIHLIIMTTTTCPVNWPMTEWKRTLARFPEILEKLPKYEIAAKRGGERGKRKCRFTRERIVDLPKILRSVEKNKWV